MLAAAYFIVLYFRLNILVVFVWIIKKTQILRVNQKIRSLSEIGRVIEAARAAANHGTNYTRFMDHHSPTFAIHSPLMNPRWHCKIIEIPSNF